MSEYEIITSDLSLAWKYCVRALNAAENSNLNNTAENLANLVIKLSQQLEFCQKMREVDLTSEEPQ